MATILVIDDERPLCDLLKEMLQQHGHEVFTAYTGREGVARHKERRPRFTILDLHLPDMSGIEVLRKLRAKKYAGGVMMLTAVEDYAILKQTLDLEAVDILGKPIDLERLALAIQVGLILNRRARESGSAQHFRRSPG